MTGEELLMKIELADPEFVEEADRLPQTARSLGLSYRLSRFAAICAVISMLVLTACASAVAADRLLVYFKGNTDEHIEGLIQSATAATDGRRTLRIDGAIADGHTCHLVVSALGLNEAEKKKLENVYANALEAWAEGSGGERLTFWNWGASLHSRRTGIWSRSWSAYADADVTWVLTCGFDTGDIMNRVEEICVSYDGLTVRLDVKQHTVEEYTLIPQGESELRNLSISPLGAYMEVPVSWFSREPGQGKHFDIDLIRRDGSLETDGKAGLSLASGYNTPDTYAFVQGSWKMKKENTVGILDLEEYCGIRINGTDYYFAQPQIP